VVTKPAENGPGPERQLPLFGGESLNPVPALKLSLNLAVRESGLSRAQVADRLNEVLGREGLRTRGRDGVVSLALLEKWLAPADTAAVMPAKFLPAFCRVTGSLAPLMALARPLGAAVIGPEDQVLLELARALMAERAASRRRRRLEEEWKSRNGRE
jgi:hypothetical protein